LLTNAAGYVSLTIPPGPFRVSEFRELGPLPGASKNLPSQSQPAVVSGVRSRIRYQEGQSGPYQWSMAPNIQIQVDIVCAVKSRATQSAGQRLETMSVTGPGPHGNWVITIPLRATVVGLKASSPQETQPAAVNHPYAAKVAAPSASAQRLTVEDLKLRLSALQGLKVKTSARTRNPGAMAAQHGAMPGGLNSGVAPSGNPAKLSMAPGSNPTTPGLGQADPAMSRQTASASPCRSYTKKDPLLVAVDGQTGPWVFSNEPHTYRLTGCSFGAPEIFLMLSPKDPSAPWHDDMPLHVLSWSDEEITVEVIGEVKNGKAVPVPDIDPMEIHMYHGIKMWSIGKAKFHAVRGDPVPLSLIPQSAVSAFQQGSPNVLSPMTNFYGVNGSMGIVRPSLSNPVPLGQDTVKLNLKSGFVIDSVQLQHLVYDNQGQSSKVNADPSHLTINGMDIAINWPIDSVTQNGQTFYYSIYGLNVWVVGPKGIDPW
jgi:hypothetical protein